MKDLLISLVFQLNVIVQLGCGLEIHLYGTCTLWNRHSSASTAVFLRKIWTGLSPKRDCAARLIARVLRIPPTDCSFSQASWKKKPTLSKNNLEKKVVLLFYYNIIMQGRMRSKTRTVAILMPRPCSCHTDRAASCARDARSYMYTVSKITCQHRL